MQGAILGTRGVLCPRTFMGALRNLADPSIIGLRTSQIQIPTGRSIYVRIVLDAYWWVRGTQSLRYVVHGLIETWSAIHPEDELTIVVRRKHLREITSLPANVRLASTRLWPQALVATIAVPWQAKRARADAMLSHNFSPLFGKNRAVFIHDLTFATNPEWFTSKELLYYRWMIRLARRADVVFSSTETEGKRISSFTKASLVVAAGLGMSDEVLTGNEEPVRGLTPGSFMLTVGRLNVRKNVEVILEGAKQSQLLSTEFPLVIVGIRDGKWKAFPEWVHREERLGHIIFTGFLSVGELRWLIKNCSFYVSLSLDEGFGLPPVEARLLGATVLVSDRPVFHETLGDEATFVEPTSPQAVSKAMTNLAVTQSESAPPKSHLLARHTWRRTVSIIRREMSGPGS
jgi:glycosyltransferase involved in cell wall biosynthesis